MLERKVAVAACVTTLGLAVTSTSSFADQNEGTITAHSLNIRSGPGTNHSVVTYAKKGDKVQIIESSNGWHKVKLQNGKIGWASGKYISDSSQIDSSNSESTIPLTGKKGIVTTSTLNIRSGSSTRYSIIAKVYREDKVQILDNSNGWYKVKLSNGKIGWASGHYISVEGSSESSSTDFPNNNITTPSTGKKGIITTSALNIRSGSSTGHAILTKAYKGDIVEILESSNGWYKVKLSNGKVGWASGHYISIAGSSESSSTDSSSNDNTTTPSTGKKGIITTGSLNIRSGPSTGYSVITKVHKGNKVEILDSSNGWYKVKLQNGKVGWASGAYIKISFNSDSSESTDPSGSTLPEIEDAITSQDKIQKIISVAKAQVGKPYIWGAEGPNSFDCSGLTYYVYKQIGITLPRVSSAQYSSGSYVSWNNLQPGDLMFSSTDGSGRITHVGIYIGNGEMIHAPKPGDVVKRSSVNNSYWKNAHIGAKRIL